MKLANTKQYYEDLAYHYFYEGKINLMTLFRDMSTNTRYSYSNEDTKDWFTWSKTNRPERGF